MRTVVCRQVVLHPAEQRCGVQRCEAIGMHICVSLEVCGNWRGMGIGEEGLFARRPHLCVAEPFHFEMALERPRNEPSLSCIPGELPAENDRFAAQPDMAGPAAHDHALIRGAVRFLMKISGFDQPPSVGSMTTMSASAPGSRRPLEASPMIRAGDVDTTSTKRGNVRRPCSTPSLNSRGMRVSTPGTPPGQSSTLSSRVPVSGPARRNSDR